MTTAWQSLGAYSTGTGTANPAYATPGNGDLCVIGAAFGNLNNVPLDTPAGWTLLPNSTRFGGDAAAYGVDTGKRGVMAFYRICDGTEGTSLVTLNNPGTGTTTRNTSAQMMRFTKTAAQFYISASTGIDESAGVGYSVTADGILIPANGDTGVALTTWIPDTGTSGTPTLAWDGVGNTTIQGQSIASTQGNDLRYQIFRRALLGAGGSAPVFATTSSASVVGPTAFILVHDGPASAVVPSGWGIPV